MTQKNYMNKKLLSYFFSNLESNPKLVVKTSMLINFPILTAIWHKQFEKCEIKIILLKFLKGKKK